MTCARQSMWQVGVTFRQAATYCASIAQPRIASSALECSLRLQGIYKVFRPCSARSRGQGRPELPCRSVPSGAVYEDLLQTSGTTSEHSLSRQKHSNTCKDEAGSVAFGLARPHRAAQASVHRDRKQPQVIINASL